MKKDFVILGLAAAAAWFILGKKGASSGTKEVFDASTNERFSNGWRYFSDGTSIDPQGNYYSGNALIWSPAPAGGATGTY